MPVKRSVDFSRRIASTVYAQRRIEINANATARPSSAVSTLAFRIAVADDPIRSEIVCWHPGRSGMVQIAVL